MCCLISQGLLICSASYKLTLLLIHMVALFVLICFCLTLFIYAQSGYFVLVHVLPYLPGMSKCG